jgi:hypothetical protein
MAGAGGFVVPLSRTLPHQGGGDPKARRPIAVNGGHPPLTLPRQGERNKRHTPRTARNVSGLQCSSRGASSSRFQAAGRYPFAPQDGLWTPLTLKASFATLRETFAEGASSTTGTPLLFARLTDFASSGT